MTPFDLRGPEFLVFYGMLATVTMVAYLVWRALSDRGGRPSTLAAEPYLVAYLRGGRIEALRLALFTLMAEGNLVREGRLLQRTAEAPPRPLAPLEAEVWAELEAWRTLDGLFRDGVGAAACDALEAELKQLGYRRTERENDRDHFIKLLLGGLLALVGTVKIIIAISRGHHNVVFLVMLIFVFAAVSFRKPSALTSRGERALAGTQALLQGRALGESTVEPAELAMVMAAFGLLAFRHADYPFLAALGAPRFQLASAGSVGGGTSCSSSFSSSSCGGGGSSCGSSCGGGGGGGCGGCGS